MVTRLRILVAVTGLAALLAGGVRPLLAGEKVTFSGTGAGAAITNRTANQLRFPMLRIDNQIGSKPDENVDTLLAPQAVTQAVRQPDAKQLEKDDLRRNWIFQAAVGTNELSASDLTRQDISLTNNPNARPRTLVERFLAGNESDSATNNANSRGLTNKISGSMTDLEDKLDLDRREKSRSPGQTAGFGNGSGGVTNRSGLVFSGSNSGGPDQPDGASVTAGGPAMRDSSFANSALRDEYQRMADKRALELKQSIFGSASVSASQPGTGLNRDLTGTTPGYSSAPINVNSGSGNLPRNGYGTMNTASRNNLLNEPNSGGFYGGSHGMTNAAQAPVVTPKPTVFELPRRAF